MTQITVALTAVNIVMPLLMIFITGYLAVRPGHGNPVRALSLHVWFVAFVLPAAGLLLASLTRAVAAVDVASRGGGAPELGVAHRRAVWATCLPAGGLLLTPVAGYAAAAVLGRVFAVILLVLFVGFGFLVSASAGFWAWSYRRLTRMYQERALPTPRLPYSSSGPYP